MQIAQLVARICTCRGSILVEENTYTRLPGGEVPLLARQSASQWPQGTLLVCAPGPPIAQTPLSAQILAGSNACNCRGFYCIGLAFALHFTSIRSRLTRPRPPPWRVYFMVLYLASSSRFESKVAGCQFGGINSDRGTGTGVLL